jgi:hypothetical protein
VAKASSHLEQLQKGIDILEARSMEALKVYRPSPQQLEFHLSTASERIVRGGKRAGKTLAVIMEFVSMITGQPIIGPDGKPLPLKHRVPSAEDPGLFWVIGFDVKHIGQTIFPKLFKPGLFRIIRDEKTGQWRTWNKTDPADAARAKESRPAPPAIPERLIDANSWNFSKKRAGVFESVKLQDTKGHFATICAYPSTGDHAKQGDAVDGIWIDEDIEKPDFLKEWQDRLTDRDGWFLWSVWPHVANYALINTLDRAEEHKDDDSPPIAAFQLLMTENPYHTDEAKKKAMDRMGDDEEIARRNRGDLLLDTLAMYDFAPAYHLIKRPERAGSKPETVREALELALQRHGKFPRDWTRYLSIDPSHSRTAVLVGVVPPPFYEGVAMGQRLLIEGELIAKKANAQQLAEQLLPLIQGLSLEAMVMDMHAGRQTWAGQDKSVCEHYSTAFKKAGIIARATGSGFLAGSDQKVARQRAVRSLLDPAEDGLPGLFLISERTPATQKEFHTYRKKQQAINGEMTILDEPANPRKHDCMAALEYLTEHVWQLMQQDGAYVPPQVQISYGSGAYRAAQAMLNANEKKEYSGYVHLGPGAAA